MFVSHLFVSSTCCFFFFHFRSETHIMCVCVSLCVLLVVCPANIKLTCKQWRAYVGVNVDGAFTIGRCNDLILITSVDATSHAKRKATQRECHVTRAFHMLRMQWNHLTSSSKLITFGATKICVTNRYERTTALVRPTLNEWINDDRILNVVPINVSLSSPGRWCSFNEWFPMRPQKSNLLTSTCNYTIIAEANNECRPLLRSMSHLLLSLWCG